MSQGIADRLINEDPERVRLYYPGAHTVQCDGHHDLLHRFQCEMQLRANTSNAVFVLLHYSDGIMLSGIVDFSKIKVKAHANRLQLFKVPINVICGRGTLKYVDDKGRPTALRSMVRFEHPQQSSDNAIRPTFEPSFLQRIDSFVSVGGV